MCSKHLRSMAAHPAGKGIPESPEVRWERETDQALHLANSHWHRDWSSRDRWTDWIAPAVMVTGLYLLVMAATVAGEWLGWWAA